MLKQKPGAEFLGTPITEEPEQCGAISDEKIVKKTCLLKAFLSLSIQFFFLNDIFSMLKLPIILTTIFPPECMCFFCLFILRSFVYLHRYKPEVDQTIYLYFNNFPFLTY